MQQRTGDCLFKTCPHMLNTRYGLGRFLEDLRYLDVVMATATGSSSTLCYIQWFVVFKHVHLFLFQGKKIKEQNFSLEKYTNGKKYY